MKRPRGPGGRFLSVAELAALDAQDPVEQNALNTVSMLSHHVLNGTHPMLSNPEHGYGAM
jgi:hypothetical protein